jgi:hypothetical protein
MTCTGWEEMHYKLPKKLQKQFYRSPAKKGDIDDSSISNSDNDNGDDDDDDDNNNNKLYKISGWLHPLCDMETWVYRLLTSTMSIYLKGS